MSQLGVMEAAGDGETAGVINATHFIIVTPLARRILQKPDIVIVQLEEFFNTQTVVSKLM